MPEASSPPSPLQISTPRHLRRTLRSQQGVVRIRGSFPPRGPSHLLSRTAWPSWNRLRTRPTASWTTPRVCGWSWSGRGEGGAAFRYKGGRLPIAHHLFDVGRVGEEQKERESRTEMLLKSC